MNFWNKEFEIKLLLLLFKSTYTDPDPYIERLMSFFIRGRSVAVWLERWNCNLEARVQVPLRPLAGFVHGSPEFNSLATLVNSQLACFRPVGILNPVMFNLNYLFQAFARPH